MDFLYSLLFIPFSYAYCWLLGVMFRYIIYGERGARYIRYRDNLKKGKKSHLSTYIGLFITFLAVYVGIWFSSIVSWVIAINGKQGVSQDEIRQYGLIAVIGLPLLYFAVASIVRSMIKKRAGEITDEEYDLVEQANDEAAG